jgi:thioredoxin reductase
VRIREEAITALVGENRRLERIEFAAGPAEHRDALFVRTRREQPNDLAEALGCELTAGGTIATDGDGRTDVPGVFAAGDAATEHSRSVANAMGTGSRVAYAVTSTWSSGGSPIPSSRRHPRRTRRAASSSGAATPRGRRGRVSGPVR